jgi:hypothetical protein
VFSAKIASATSTFVFATCTYNGVVQTLDYNSGLITVTNWVQLVIGAVAYDGTHTTVTCTVAPSVGSIQVAISDVTGASSHTGHGASCSTSGCTASIAHSSLTSGNLAVGYFAGGCGTGWTLGGANACYGTDTSANTFTYTFGVGYGAAVAFEDLGGGAPPAVTYPGAGMVGDAGFEQLVRLL